MNEPSRRVAVTHPETQRHTSQSELEARREKVIEFGVRNKMKMISEIGMKPEGTRERVNTEGSSFEKDGKEGIRRKRQK